ncbi:MAG: hypothetical protein F7B19_05645 [Desulfurococcales archaeon]|nr:hypothetical protein [Desulfurococcales archaeon]
MPISWALHSALLVRARAILYSAWNDYYAGDYEWTIRKAWISSSIATLHLNPSGDMPLAARAYYSSCERLTKTTAEASLLDSYNLAVSDEWLRLVVGSTISIPGKQEALEALEASVKILDSVHVCGPMRLEISAPPPVSFSNSIKVGNTLIAIIEGVKKESLFERLRKFKEYLNPLYFNIVLAPDEALGYLQLPGPSWQLQVGEVEAVTDEDGVASYILSARPDRE